MSREWPVAGCDSQSSVEDHSNNEFDSHTQGSDRRSPSGLSIGRWGSESMFARLCWPIPTQSGHYYALLELISRLQYLCVIFILHESVMCGILQYKLPDKQNTFLLWTAASQSPLRCGTRLGENFQLMPWEVALPALQDPRCDGRQHGVSLPALCGLPQSRQHCQTRSWMARHTLQWTNIGLPGRCNREMYEFTIVGS